MPPRQEQVDRVPQGCRSCGPGFDIPDESVRDAAEVHVKYLILIYGNPASQAIWEGFSDAQRAEGLAYYAALNEDLVESGEMIASAALADPSVTRRVLVREGQTITSDGPFAEVKEHLAGILLVGCEGLERAVEVAARVPEAALGLVEVRPVRELDALEQWS
jgi:hypothetical protein